LGQVELSREPFMERKTKVCAAHTSHTTQQDYETQEGIESGRTIVLA
jgi:hypothetical protein